MSDASQSPDALPDDDAAHGVAALLLVESLLHELMERSVLSVANVIEIVDTAIDVQTSVAEAAVDGGTANAALALLCGIARSIARDA